jgi:diguanylate cyclase (GGDEF)-like protein
MGKWTVTILVRGTRLPQRSLTGWLVDPGRENLPDSIRIQLFSNLYGTLPIFLGGVFNTLLVALVITARHPTPLFIFWACIEMLLAIVRAPVLIAGRRAIAQGRRGPSDLHILLACLWAASVGFGGLVCVLSGDWVASTLAFLSAAGMVGGICFRNFSAPRLAAVMIVLSLGPCAAGGIISGEPILLVTALQIPLYLFAMSAAAFKLNRMLIERMEAELEKDHRVRHDSLTGLVNRAGLAAALDRRAACVPGAEGEDVAYLFLDLDGFKRVNDTLGHSAGDRLLVEVAARLRSVVSPDDIVARIGGDEFLIVTRGDGPARARSLGEEAIRALAGTPFLFGDEGVDIGVSVGIALSAEHGTAFAGLIDAADAALYQAKARGRCQCVIATAGPRLAAERGRRTASTVRLPERAAG